MFAAKIPAFIVEIRRLFTFREICNYLDQLERTRYLAPQDVDLGAAPDKDLEEEQDWLENAVMGAEELLRFSRVRELLFRYSNMAKARRNDDRESRISEKIVVDAYGPEERAMAWYYYLEEKLQFPFHAQCIASVPTSPLRKGDSIEIRKMAPEDSCSTDMLVLTRWNDRNIAVPLSQLKPIGVDESTTEAIEDWHYWVGQGNCI